MLKDYEDDKTKSEENKLDSEPRTCSICHKSVEYPKLSVYKQVSTLNKNKNIDLEQIKTIFTNKSNEEAKEYDINNTNTPLMKEVVNNLEDLDKTKYWKDVVSFDINNSKNNLIHSECFNNKFMNKDHKENKEIYCPVCGNKSNHNIVPNSYLSIINQKLYYERINITDIEHSYDERKKFVNEQITNYAASSLNMHSFDIFYISKIFFKNYHTTTDLQVFESFYQRILFVNQIKEIKFDDQNNFEIETLEHNSYSALHSFISPKIKNIEQNDRISMEFEEILTKLKKLEHAYISNLTHKTGTIEEFNKLVVSLKSSITDSLNHKFNDIFFNLTKDELIKFLEFQEIKINNE